jgi:hypothetical protein
MACPGDVRLPAAIGRFLSPDRVADTIFSKPLDPTIGTSRPIRPRVLPGHGALTAIENP